MLKQFLEGLWGLLYPSNCLVCKTFLGADHQTQNLCSKCLAALKVNRPPFCPQCPHPLVQQHDEFFCPNCRQFKYDFDRAWAAISYNDAAKELIHLFKYKNKTSLKKHLLEFLCSFIENYSLDMSRFDMIVPIPLSRARLRERGYNQTQLLSEGLAQKFCRPQSLGNLTRVRHTQNQALLKKQQRWTNISGAFKIENPEEFHQRSILIIDDLFTTGATVSEAARVLKESGAKHVEALTLAITE